MKQSNYYDLQNHLSELFKSASYSKSTVKDMEFVLDAFSEYMHENNLEEYTPKIGEDLVKHCKDNLKLCNSRVRRAINIVAKLNRLSSGLDGKDALLGLKLYKPYVPSHYRNAIDEYISYCRESGNKENTIRRKELICNRFLANLEAIGISDLKNANGKDVLKAFFELGYDGYWQTIRGFLKFLYENTLLPRDYTNLFVYRRKKIMLEHKKYAT